MVKVCPLKLNALSLHRCLTLWNRLWNYRRIRNLCLSFCRDKSISLAHLFDTLLKCVPLNKPVSSNISMMPVKDMMPQIRIVCLHPHKILFERCVWLSATRRKPNPGGFPSTVTISFQTVCCPVWIWFELSFAAIRHRKCSQHIYCLCFSIKTDVVDSKVNCDWWNNW